MKIHIDVVITALGKLFALLLVVCISTASSSDVGGQDYSQANRISLGQVQWKINWDETVKNGQGKANGWEKPDFDDSQWKEIKIGKSWEEQGYNRNGVGWYRGKFVVPQEWQGQKLMLLMGRPDDGGELFLNGKRLQTIKKFGKDFSVLLTAADIKYNEENVIAVRVWDWYKNGGLNDGVFVLERVAPFAQRGKDKIVPPQQLSLTENIKDGVLEKQRWEYGWRDGGTSDTRPKLAVERGALNGSDAIVLDVWYPNSAEFVDYTLRAGERGGDWKGKGFNYLSFFYKADMPGEIKIRLNNGKVGWGKGKPGYEARVFLEPGGWKKVILPFSAFLKKAKYNSAPESMADPSSANVISIGFGNHELQKVGKIRFSDFTAGSFNSEPESVPVLLNGLWKFKTDNQRPDGQSSDFKAEGGLSDKDKVGYGLEYGWNKPEFDDSTWDIINVPGNWESQGFNYDGPAWFRQQVMIPEQWAGKPLRLRLGAPDDRGELFFNGEQVQGIDKYGEEFNVLLQPSQIKYGQLNSIAVRIYDWHQRGGFDKGVFSITPDPAKLLVSEPGKAPVAPEKFEMGVKPGKELEVVLNFWGGLTKGDGQKIEYRLVDCFHKTVISGDALVRRLDNGELQAVLPLNKEQARQLYYGEWFDLSVLLADKAGKPIKVFAWFEQKLKYEERDSLALAELPETYEETPYGRLKLVDTIDCGTSPLEDVHPYKEGGIRASWVGRRAYATWVNGVTVEEFKGKKYREVNNNQFFGYRIGRGKLKQGKGYVLRVMVPDNKARYFVMDIKSGRNYQGTGYMSGVSPDDPQVHYPLSNEYQWYDHMFMNDDVGYGYKGARSVSSENGIWVMFHDNGRCYTGQYEAGPGVAQIRLYEVDDIEKHLPQINYPQNLPRRVLMMDWEREPEAPVADVVKWSKFSGLTDIGPVFQKWAFGGYWKTGLGFKPPSWHKVSREGENDEDIYGKWLSGTRGQGIGLIPRIEYGGGPNLPKDAWVIGRNGKIDPCGRYCTWGANILDPRTWEEFKTVVDEIVGRELKANPQITGLLWRQRQDRIKCSYGIKDVEMFCKETGAEMPKGNAQEIAKWASVKMSKQYHKWWQEKRADFLRRARDLLKSYRKDLVLYYYNWDRDGWSLGLEKNKVNTAQDWSDLYNVDKAGEYWKRLLEQRKQIPADDYTKMLKSFGQPHDNIYPGLFKDDKDIVIFAPVHWRYLADNDSYINYFKTGDGLAICNMFNYEEKGRANVQGDRYETSELTPGGHDFGVAEEVLACFHGDPNVITWTPYTYGRGWIDVHRRFAQAFLALPDMRGIVVENALKEADRDVRVRTYNTDNGTYVGVVSRKMKAAEFAVTVKAAGNEVVDLVTGKQVPATVKDGSVSFVVDSAAMQLNSYLIK